MGLEVDLPDGGDPLRASRVSLVRALGQPVRWRFRVEITHDTKGGEDTERLAKLLIGGPTKLKAQWRAGGDVALGPEATVVGTTWLKGDTLDFVEIEVDGTAPELKPNAFVPRRRVHRVKNMKQLAERFENVARCTKGVKNVLEDVKLKGNPDKAEASIVQDGVSDWEFFSHILDQCAFLTGGGENWLPLLLVGGVSQKQGTEGRWVVTPGVKAAYADWGDVKDRVLQFKEGRGADSDERLLFHSLSNAVRAPDFAAGAYPAIIRERNGRVFDPQRWESWRTTDLPAFTSGDEAMVWKIEDTLRQSGSSGSTVLVWDTDLHTLPPQAAMTGPLAASRLRPWIGLGTIRKSSSKGPWVQVQLPGFQEEEDILDARISSPFSGKNGQRGQHMVPLDGTQVALGWNGRFDHSIIVLGNARTEEAEFASPSMYLEDPATAQFDTVHAMQVGKITVDSDLETSVQKSITTSAMQNISSSAMQKIEASATMELSLKGAAATNKLDMQGVTIQGLLVKIN